MPGPEYLDLQRSFVVREDYTESELITSGIGGQELDGSVAKSVLLVSMV